MSFLEDIGDRAIRSLNAFVYHLLGLLIKALKIGRKITLNLERIEEEKIFPIFRRRNIEFKDYIILKVQISSLGFLLFSVLYIFNVLGQRKFLALGLITSIYTIYLTFSGVKEHFEEDFHAYRDFFLSYMGIAVVLIIIKRFKPFVNFIFPYSHLVLASVIGVVAIDVLFKAKYGRDFTVGTVIKAGPLAKVKISYDICASIKPGIQIFENHIKAKEGDIVKLRVEKGFLNLKGSKVTEMIGVVDG